MKTVTEKYHAVNEGALSKAEFVRQMRLAHPQLISQFNGFDDSVQILKNRGLLFEKKDEAEYENPSYNLSPDAVRRGLRYELELAGLDPAGDISEADYIKAHKKAEENIMKDQLHYYRMITHGETKVEHDKMKETKRGAQETDADNAMAKVKLNEDVESKDEVESRTEKVGKAIVKDTEVMNTVKSFMKDAGLSYDIDSAKRTAKALYSAARGKAIEDDSIRKALNNQSTLLEGKGIKDKLVEFGKLLLGGTGFLSFLAGVTAALGNFANAPMYIMVGLCVALIYKVITRNDKDSLYEEDINTNTEQEAKQLGKSIGQVGEKAEENLSLRALADIILQKRGIDYNSDSKEESLENAEKLVEDIKSGNLGEVEVAVANFLKNNKNLNEAKKFKQFHRILIAAVGGAGAALTAFGLEKTSPIAVILLKKAFGAFGFKVIFLGLALIAAATVMKKFMSDDDTLKEEPNEGNKFEAERLKAIKGGKEHFKVDGKTFPVKGVGADDKKRAAMNEAEQKIKQALKKRIVKILKEGHEETLHMDIPQIEEPEHTNSSKLSSMVEDNQYSTEERKTLLKLDNLVNTVTGDTLSYQEQLRSTLSEFPADSQILDDALEAFKSDVNARFESAFSNMDSSKEEVKSEKEVEAMQQEQERLQQEMEKESKKTVFNENKKTK